ncbi:10355_t:CDS:2 [Diversispora eburnea]|uniref:10355_t:CDS:1 n=1 Tax=Diversispora eburnea TaxID=1213867 RepID=A0A9N9CWS1_9GLOM|nr:10355_t:CDS:2 [Diversispora eburnea]
MIVISVAQKTYARDGDAFGEEYEIQLKKFLKIVCKNSILTYDSSVRYLKISDYHKLSNKISQAYPNLIHLNVFNNGRLTDHSIIELANRCSKLQYLEISWGGNITDKSIYEIARSCYCLRHLGISGGKSCISDKSIREITRFNPNIQSLNFNNCKKLTDITIHALVGSYLDLRELDLSDCKRITDIGIRQIAQCRNLEHLALNYLKFLSDEMICIIVQSYPSISYLNLKFCNITDTAVEAVTQSCRNIEYLNFYGSKSITDKSISKLAKICSKVRDLELGFCELITDIAIKDIAHRLFDLKYLGLKYYINISKEVLDMLNSDLDIGGYYTIPSTL